MKLRVVPASRGVSWVREGVGLTFKQPLGFISLLGLVVATMMLVMSLPQIGPPAVIAIMPMMWMAFMLASRRVLAGERLTPSVLIEPLKDASNRLSWLRLGGLYALVTFLLIILGGLLGPDIEELAKVMESTDDPQAVLLNPAVQSSLLWRFALTLPVSLVFWHTPALLHWGHMPVAKALFFSAVASWRNLGAFVVYGACWLALLVAVAGVMQLVTALIPVRPLAAMLGTVGGLWIAAAFYASLYFTVVDCFETGPAGQDGTASAKAPD